MTHIAYRAFDLSDGKHSFAYGEVRYTFEVTPGRPARTWVWGPGDFYPEEPPEVEITQIEVSMAPGKHWMKVDGLLWDFLREVDDAWFLEQISEDEK